MKAVAAISLFILSLLAIVVLFPDPALPGMEVTPTQSPATVMNLPAISTEPFAEIEFTVTLPDPTATEITLMAIPTSTPLPTLVVTADVLHLRSCPDLDCEVLDWLEQGETLVWTGECSQQWAHVMLHNGWVYSIYVAPDVCQ